MHTFIRDFAPSQFVEGVYCLQNAQLGQTKQGKPYLKAIVRDRTGHVVARMWNVSEDWFAQLPTDGFVWLEGHTQPYQGEMQLIVQSLSVTTVEEEQLHNLLPTSRFDRDEMLRELTGLLDSIRHPALRALLRAYLDDERLMRAFSVAPAAVSMHHAFLGGLLEHTLQLCRLADRICPLYPQLNRDLIIAGLFLHDLAKCHELRFDSGFSYSDAGQLLGHLVMGSLLLQRKAEEAAAKYGQKLPQEALMVLHHIIISHHGVPEYGAAKTPSTPEAIFISRLDDLDAKVQMSLECTRLDSANKAMFSGPFTGKLWALDTRLYWRDPLPVNDAKPADATQALSFVIAKPRNGHDGHRTHDGAMAHDGKLFPDGKPDRDGRSFTPDGATSSDSTARRG